MNKSKAVTASLIKLQLEQNAIYNVNRTEDKYKVEKLQQNTQKLNAIRCFLSDEKLKSNDIHQEKYASIWLSTLPLKDKGFCLNKKEFWDLVKLRYSWSLSRLPIHLYNICTTSFVLQKRRFYNSKTQPY